MSHTTRRTRSRPRLARAWHFAAALAAGLLAGALPQAGAAPKPPAVAGQIEDKRSDLEDLKTRIKELQAEVAKSEESREDAADALRETEQSISNSQRRLRELAEMRRTAEKELAGVTEKSRALEGKIKSQQGDLEQLLKRYYMSGQAQGLRHLLSGSDPNQLARDLYYLKQLSKSEADLIGGLRASLDEQKQLEDQARTTRDALAEIERDQSKEVAQLAKQQKEHQTVLAKISDQLRGQRKEVANLKQDEARLTRLIDGLAELARKQAAAEEKARRQAQLAEEKRRAAEEKRRLAEEKRAAAEAAAAAARDKRAGQTTPAPIARPAPVEDEPPPKPAAPIARVEETPEPQAAHTPFEQLRGQMRLPVRGELMNRFGSPRSDGGASWRGVFIRAASGAEVKAIAAGKVVFADWLRGFGNLVIVDHGAGYLSIYGYNESLLRQVGQQVKAGELLASVGTSGGSEESGLYFELRHKGQPIDPLRWVSLR